MSRWEVTFVELVDALDRNDAVEQAKELVYRGWVEAEVVETQEKAAQAEVV